MEQHELLDVAFAQNPEQRALCCVLADCSGSMKGEPIAALNRGLVALAESLSADPLASTRVELCVIAFGSTVTVAQDWISAVDFRPPTLTAGGTTRLGTGISTALAKLHERKVQLNQVSVPMYRPWLILLSDGVPYGEPAAVLDRASADLTRAHTGRKLIPFPVGVGENADLALLENITGAKSQRLQGLAFEEFFCWVSASLGALAVSQSDAADVPGGAVDVWARIPTR